MHSKYNKCCGKCTSNYERNQMIQFIAVFNVFTPFSLLQSSEKHKNAWTLAGYFPTMEWNLSRGFSGLETFDYTRVFKIFLLVWAKQIQVTE